MHKTTRARTLGGYRLDLTSADGTRGTADLTHLAGRGVFVRGCGHAEFRRVRIGAAGEPVWPGGLDLCPALLRLRVTGKEPEDVFPGLEHESAHA